MTRAHPSDVWRTLSRLRDHMGPETIAQLFAADADRFRRLSWQLDGVLLDLSKLRIPVDGFRDLITMSRDAGLEALRDDMFAGRRINASEDRRVLHVALRDRTGIADASVRAEVADVTARLRAFTEGVRAQRITGTGGAAFSDIVNIGIGGSHLGPMLAARAGADQAGPRVHFVANVDGHELAAVLHGLRPETTLFLVASKTFTTQETMTNAASAKRWLIDALGPEAPAGHFGAMTAAPDKARAFGLPEDRIFPMWDWVGGRFSMWSAVGLPAALAMGWTGFSELLDGAHTMDRHFLETPLEDNLPVLLALAGIWNANVENLPALAVVPYDERLAALPAYLQQLDMESNGKAVTADGLDLPASPSPAVFGLAGTNAQHTFHQWLHQGPHAAAVEFIGVARPDHGLDGHHDPLIANMLAQAEALAMGTDGDGDPHRACPGNRPSTTILLETLDPRRLGMLLALYEHKIFVQGALWGLNSFDQFGVELGKKLAGRLLPALTGDGGDGSYDSSTAGLIAAYRSWRKTPP